MRSIREAMLAMQPAFGRLDAERRVLLEAHGRFLASDVLASEDAPAFDQSAMDGYAVHAEDVSTASPDTPIILPMVDESRAGGHLPLPLARGTLCRVFTGARMPEHANAVVIQEDTSRDVVGVHIKFAPRLDQHVRRRGSDVARGDRIVAAGTQIGAAEIALLASQGHTTVSVTRRPRVAIISTGDELTELGEPKTEGTIINGNAWAIAASVIAAGGEPLVMPIARDVLEEVSARIAASLHADVVVTTGGVSVGDHDVTRDAMALAGVTLDFWKVAMKPGKPMAFGLAGKTPVVGLPGNPVSAQTTFDVFLRPMLRSMLGDPRPFQRLVPVALGHAHDHSTGRLELARARFERRGDILVAHLAKKQGSASLSGFASLDGYVLLPADQRAFTEGEMLRALPVRDIEGVPEPAFP